MLKGGVLANLAVASLGHLVQVIRHSLKKIQYRTGPASSKAASPGIGLALDQNEHPTNITNQKSLENVWLVCVRRGVRSWEQNGSGLRRASAPKRGDRSRMKPRDQPERLPLDHPLACALSCGHRCHMLESDAGWSMGRDMGHLLTSCGSYHDELCRTTFYEPPTTLGITRPVRGWCPTPMALTPCTPGVSN